MIIKDEQHLQELLSTVRRIAFAGGAGGIAPGTFANFRRPHLPVHRSRRHTLGGVEIVLRGVDVVESRIIVYAERSADVRPIVDALREATTAPVTVLAGRSACDFTSSRVAGPGSRISRPAFGVAGTVTAVLKSTSGARVVSAAHVIAGGSGVPFRGECLALDGVRSVALEKWNLPTTSTAATVEAPDAGTAGPHASLSRSGAWPDGVPYIGEGTFLGAVGPFTVHPYRATGFAPIAVEPVALAPPVVLVGVTYKGVVGMRSLAGQTWLSGDSGAALRDGAGRVIAMLVGRLTADKQVGVFTPWEVVRARLDAWSIP